MKRLILSLIFIITAAVIHATDYYVATAANNGDNAHNGSIGSPWLTLTYACSQVSAGAHTIHVGAGTFNESARANLNVGVSIVGASQTTTIINYTYANNDFESGCIRLYSSSLDNSANQSISYLTIDGDQDGDLSDGIDAYNAITVYNRGNVDIHHCTIRNFYSNGIYFGGPTDILTTHAEDNQVYNCIITDCSKRQSGAGYGSIMIRGQHGLLIYNNTLSNLNRPEGDNGNIINAVRGGYEGMKIYNNVFRKPNYDGGEWNFHAEVWQTHGGNEWYNNEFYGGECAIDIASTNGLTYTLGHFKGVYDYSHYIHDNLFDHEEKWATPEVDNNRFYITIEDCNVNDVWITRNHFIKTPCAISIEMGTGDAGPYSNIFIYYNIFEDIGYEDDSFAGCVYIKSYGANAVYNNLKIQNNTMIGGATGHPHAGVLFYLSGTVNGLDVSNNIIENSSVAWLKTGSNATKGTINSLVLKNNILYGNANSNLISDATSMIAAGTFVEADNQEGANPDFVSSSDFHLTDVSPALNAGINLDLELDYDSVAVAATPDIGAYEYVEPAVAPTVTTTAVTNITTTTASSGGNVTSDGGGSMSARGIVWHTSSNPTISSYLGMHINGQYEGSYTGDITSMTAGTTYHVRAFATNEVGTSYGSDIEFTSASEPSTNPSMRLKDGTGRWIKNGSGSFVIEN